MRPLRILYDLASVDPSRDGGAAQRYVSEVARTLEESGMAEVRVVGGDRTCGPAWVSAFRRRQHAREVAKAIAEFTPYIVHRAGHTAPAGYRGTYRLVSTFNDVAAVKVSASSFESSHGYLICPSESARSSAIQALGFSDDRISVVPPGVRPSLSDGERRAARGNFFLFVGPRSGSGNFDSVLRAVATTPTLSHVRIVVFGGGPFSNAERKRIALLELAARVTAVSGDDNALAGHYASALALVHPALSDDFGLPVLEAMAWGCPVACSRTGSVPERGGDAALYFDPTDLNDIGTTLVHLAADSALRERMSAAGVSRAAEFTWMACAERMLSVYASTETLAARPAGATAGRS